MMIFNRNFLLILITGIYFGCSSNTLSEKDNISVVINDSNGETLPIYGLQVIDVNDGWLSTPYKSSIGGPEDPASINIPQDEPVILKFVAPGYHPKFTFLLPDFTSVEFEVSLKSSPMPEDPSPTVLGNFSNFDSRSGIEMQQDSAGVWKATIETELDTVRYFVRFNSLVAAPGTRGNIVINENANGFSESFYTEVVKPEHQSEITVEFDPSQYTFGDTDSELNIVSESSSAFAGVAQVYTLMTDEYMDQLFSQVSHQLSGKDGRYEHDYEKFLSDLENLKKMYNFQEVTTAADLAKFRFHREIELSESDASKLLDHIAPDSPLWMIHFTALTDVVNLAGLDNHVQTLEDVAEKSPFSTLRGEALYNLVRYYHDQEDEEKWHATFFELVSNYPDHFRTGYAYKYYAPEQPISEGQPLPYNEFNKLDGSGTLNLHELDESYLLMDFWATWCGPCISDMPKLHDLHEQYKDSDFAIVSISVDEDVERVQSLRNEWEMSWYHGHEQQQSSKIREMGIVGIPYYILLGPDRTVLSNDQSVLRGEDFSEILDSYLNNN